MANLEQLLKPTEDRAIKEVCVEQTGNGTVLDLKVTAEFRRNAPFCYPTSDSDEPFEKTFYLMSEKDEILYSPRDQKPFRVLTPIFQCTYLGVRKYAELVALRNERKKS